MMNSKLIRGGGEIKIMLIANQHITLIGVHMSTESNVITANDVIRDAVFKLLANRRTALTLNVPIG